MNILQQASWEAFGWNRHEAYDATPDHNGPKPNLLPFSGVSARSSELGDWLIAYRDELLRRRALSRKHVSDSAQPAFVFDLGLSRRVNESR